MATKEKTTGKRARWAGKEAALRACLAGLLQMAEGGTCFLLGAVLAGAQIFGACSPFGVAVVGAAGSGVTGFCALLGACLGYFCLQGLVGGLRYGAAAILTFSVAFAFYDVKIYKKPWFMPAVTAALCGITGFVCLSDTGWRAVDVIDYGSEILFVGTAVYFYRMAFTLWTGPGKEREKPDARQAIGLMAVGGTVLVALSGVKLLDGLSLGRMAAAAAVMMVARRGPGTGALAGVGAGISMDLASGEAPYYSMIYVVAGLAAGMLHNRGKLPAAAAYVLANGVAVLWTWQSGPRISLLYEVFAASILFLALPEKIGRMAGQFLPTREAPVHQWEQTKDFVIRRMKETAKAFRDLYETIRESLRQDDDTGQDVMVVFERASGKLCRRCALRNGCWHQEYEKTCNALNDAAAAMMQRGRAEAGDFPKYFSSRCVHFPAFVASINEELTAFLARRQYQSRMKESRTAIARQYLELDRILDQAATELGSDLTPDLPRRRQVQNYLRSRGLGEDGEVYYDKNGHLRVELPAAEELREEEEHRRLSGLLGISLRGPEERDGRLVFCQTEPFAAKAGAAGKSREGQEVSGDTGTWFRRDDGTLCILLCDGMGSGADARKESAQAVKILQNFLKAGVEPEDALRTVNAALTLKGEEAGGFTTIDLLTVELYTGLCGVYKMGAAPTYLRKEGRVSKIAGNALPAGVDSGDAARPDITRFRAEDGDWILLVSDGVLSSGDDRWLREQFSGYEGKSPGELAENLLAENLRQNGGTDDSTVIAVHLERRKRLEMPESEEAAI